jgi:hypothetical protein
MFKIVDIHACEAVRGEYVVLQNLGLITLSLRGWALCTDAYLEGDGDQMAQQMYVFREDVQINPYTRVVLFTGCGQDDWAPTTDGRQAYCAYWNRLEPVWSIATNIHVLHLSASKRIKVPNAAARIAASAGA